MSALDLCPKCIKNNSALAGLTVYMPLARWPKHHNEMNDQIKKLHAEGVKKTEIARKVRRSLRTVYRILGGE